ncbi:MAG: iron-sulfur cluster assembly scaffold protein [Salibaculum sp.]|jgi:NifU-like protein involved in Fe-S cluster formation|uniref:iron-sulfur cluster assembly scaffold protein n=1 Tax=Roseovarius halophilus (ex Wu et al. 2025) TaxID=3376060 RepID=UPI0028708B9E|nr:iron-sulfur cluster assembly scaffold protein [Salibaculum sp.]MDR9428168.1 iron-sulfur cluster assembly scaffold protein [Salibaculum sp.]MDR9482352.1 iron-sulfur cluster assembly scaffold protein [Salibaculum sp.]
MTAETDLIKLYSTRILGLAAEIPRLGRLDSPDGTGKVRSPLCGSTVSVDLRLEDGKITDYGQDVKACALGQAAAAVVAGNVIGRTEPQVQQTRDELHAMLKQDGPPPAAPFDGLEVLQPARDYKNRHASILLALDATLEAFKAAREADCA